MAVDKLVDSTQLDADLTSVANAIRTKGGTSAQLAFPAGFVSAVQAIPTGGITPSGTKQISITANGTTTEDVTNYASAEITVNVSGGDEYGEDCYFLCGGFTQQEVNSSAYSGTFWLMIDTLKDTRRVILARHGTEMVYAKNTTSGNATKTYPTGLYCTEVPDGATKLSITADKPCQFFPYVFKRSSATKIDTVISAAWTNTPVVDYPIPNDAQYGVFVFRIDSSNTAFTDQNTPTRITVTYS